MDVNRKDLEFIVFKVMKRMEVDAFVFHSDKEVKNKVSEILKEWWDDLEIELRNDKIESYKYRPKGKLEKKIYDDISRSKARLDDTIEKYQDSLKAINYSEDILKNVVIDHVDWDDFDLKGKNSLVKDICRRILYLENSVNVHFALDDIKRKSYKLTEKDKDLKQAKRLILSGERKAKSYGKPTEEERKEIERKYPLKFNLNKDRVKGLDLRGIFAKRGRDK